MADLNVYNRPPYLPGWGEARQPDLNTGPMLPDFSIPEIGQAPYIPKIPAAGQPETAVETPDVKMPGIMSPRAFGQMTQDIRALKDTWTPPPPEYQGKGKTPLPIGPQQMLEPPVSWKAPTDGVFKMDEYGRLDIAHPQAFAERYGIPLPSWQESLPAGPAQAKGQVLNFVGSSLQYMNELASRVPGSSLLPGYDLASKLGAKVGEKIATTGEAMTQEEMLAGQEFLEDARKYYMSGWQNVGFTGPAVIAGGVANSPRLAAIGLGVGSAGMAYRDFKKKFPDDIAFFLGTLSGTIEGGTELTPMEYLFKNWGRNWASGFAKYAAEQTGQEMLAEPLQAGLEYMSDELLTEEGSKMTWRDFENRMGETLKSLPFSLGMMAALGKTTQVGMQPGAHLDMFRRYLQERHGKASTPEQRAKAAGYEMLQQMNNIDAGLTPEDVVNLGRLTAGPGTGLPPELTSSRQGQAGPPVPPNMLKGYTETLASYAMQAPADENGEPAIWEPALSDGETTDTTTAAFDAIKPIAQIADLIPQVKSTDPVTLNVMAVKRTGEPLAADEMTLQAVDRAWQDMNKPIKVPTRVNLGTDQLVMMKDRKGRGFRVEWFNPGQDQYSEIAKFPDELTARTFMHRIGLQSDAAEVPMYPDQLKSFDMTAYHGSPHSFYKFDLSKIGTGEGAQAYGYGIYLAENPNIAGHYQTKLSGIGSTSSLTDEYEMLRVGDKPLLENYDIEQDPEFLRVISANDFDAAKNVAKKRISRWRELAADKSYPFRNYAEDKLKAWANLMPEIKAKNITHSGKGSLYEVDLPDSQIAKMLDWDAPLSEQPESVQRALSDIGIEQEKVTVQYRNGEKYRFDTMEEAEKFMADPHNKKLGYSDVISSYKRGKEIYHDLSRILGEQQLASEQLMSLGIPGIKYYDAASRAKGEGTRNFVLFDPSIATILTRNGEPVQLPESKAWQTNISRIDPGMRAIVPDTSPLTDADEVAYRIPNAAVHPSLAFHKGARKLTQVELDIVNVALRDVINAGFPRYIAQDIKYIAIDPVDTKGELNGMLEIYPTVKTIGINKNFLNDVWMKDGADRLNEALTTGLAHELTHFLDMDREGNSWAAAHPAFQVDHHNIQVKGNRIMAGNGAFGPMISEAINAYLGQDDLRFFFAYPFKDMVDILTMDPKDSAADLEWLKLEAFAQMGALYINYPELMRQRLPKSFAMMETIYGDIPAERLRPVNDEVQAEVRGQDPWGGIANLPGYRLADRGSPGQREQGPGAGGVQPGRELPVGYAMQVAKPVVTHRRIKSGENKGKYPGAPPLYDTPGKLPSLRKLLARLVDEGKAFKDWYRESAMAVLHASNGDMQKAERIIQLLAIFSPSNQVGGNTTAAIKAFYQWHRGEKITAGRFSAHAKNANDLMYGGKNWDGRKTNSFYINLMTELDPTVLDRLYVREDGTPILIDVGESPKIGWVKADSPVTVDMWIARIFGYPTDAVGTAQYHFSEQEIRLAAWEAGMTPHQAQAAMWVAMNGRWGQSKGGKPEAGEARYKARTKALNIDLDMQSLEAGGKSFATYLDRATEMITWEARPSERTEDGRKIASLPYDRQKSYTEDALGIIHDGSTDLLANQVGLPLSWTKPSEGAYEGAIAPNVLTGAVAERNGKYDSSLVNVYSLAAQYIYTQDGVPWFRADPTATGADNPVGVSIDFDQTLDPQREADLLTHLMESVHEEIGFTRIDDARIALINYRDGGKPFMMKDKDFLERLDAFAIQNKDNYGIVSASHFRSEGKYHYHDWAGDPDGQAILHQISKAGRSDLLPWLRDRRRRVQALSRTYAQEATPPAELPSFAVRGSNIEQAGRGTERISTPPVRSDGRIELTHWSRQEGLTQLDPSRHGTGIAGAESRRKANDPENWVDRTYYGIGVGAAGGYVKEPGLGPQQYTASIQPNELYDINVDPDGIREVAVAESKRTGGDAVSIFERTIKDSGYSGYWRSVPSMGMVAAVFKTLPTEAPAALPSFKTMDTEVAGTDLGPFLSRLNSEQDAQDLMLEVVRRNEPDYVRARRGVLPVEEIKKRAGELGWSESDLKRIPRGSGVSPEEFEAGRVITDTALQELKRLADKANGGTDADVIAFNEGLKRFKPLAETMLGIRAEWGRVGVMMRTQAAQAQELKAIMEAAGGRSTIESKAAAIADLEARGESDVEVGKLARKIAETRRIDQILEAWYASLLSGLRTHVVNTTSNALVALWTLPETLTAAMLGKTHGGSKVYFREVTARAIGMMNGLRDGMMLAKEIMREDMPMGRFLGRNLDAVLGVTPELIERNKDFLLSELGQKQEGQPRVKHLGERVLGVKLPGGGTGAWIRGPLTMLSAEDAVFQLMGQRMELYALATRQAISEGAPNVGARSQQIVDAVDDLIGRGRPKIKDMTPEERMLWQIYDDAWAAGKYQTFTNDLGPMGKDINAVMNKHPIPARLIVPFVRTPTNIIKFFGHRTPLALSMPSFWSMYNRGGAYRDIAIARILFGSAVMAAVFTLGLAGKITGGGPPKEDKNARAIWRMKYEPYSIKYGDTYYGFNRLEPIGMLFGVASDMAYLWDNMSEADQKQVWQLVHASILRNLLSKTWLTGLSEAINVFYEPARYGNQVFGRLLGTAVPTVVGHVASLNDPYIRQVNTLLDAVRNKLPGHGIPFFGGRKDLLIRYNVFGDPIQYGGILGPDLVSFIYMGTDPHDKLVDSLIAMNHFPGMPGKKIHDVELTPEQYNEYVYYRGKMARQLLDPLVNDPSWDMLSDIRKATYVDQIFNKATATAQEVMAQRYPEIPSASDAKTMKQLEGRQADLEAMQKYEHRFQVR